MIYLISLSIGILTGALLFIMLMSVNPNKQNAKGEMKSVHEKTNRMNREQIIFQIIVNSRYTEEALKKLSDERLIELYKLKVEPTMK